MKNLSELPESELKNRIDVINLEVVIYKNSGKKIFDLLKDANSTMSNRDFDKLKRGIKLCSGTLNKIDKILNNIAIMDNIDKLPSSWGTLYEMTLLSKGDEDDDSNDYHIISKINDGTFNSKTTRNQVKKVRSQVKKLNDDMANNLEGEGGGAARGAADNDEDAADNNNDDEENAAANNDDEENAANTVDMFSLTIKNEIKTYQKENKVICINNSAR